MGLAGEHTLKQRAIEYIQRYGTGAGASRLVCGNHSYHVEAEAKIAALMETETALLFNSGYQANLTLLAAVANRDSLIFSDKNNHHSLLQGANASGAKVMRYGHQDLNHLERLLKKADPNRRKWIVTESIFSMDGDLPDLEALIALSEKYSCLIYLDDAHATGVIGNNGMGMGSGKQGIEIVMGAFGKAGGVSGAFAACSQQMKRYLIQCCAGLIYSTAMPPSVIGAIDAALELIPQYDNERMKLHETASCIRKELQKSGFNTGSSTSQIIPVITGSESSALDLSSYLEEQGILALAIRPPTVPAGSSCVRFSISAKHSAEHVQRLLHALQHWHRL